MNQHARPILADCPVSTPARWPLDGQVVADLAAASSPGIAAMDARWATAVLAGWVAGGYESATPAALRTVQVAVLRDVLEACGLIDALPRWGQP